MMDAKLYIYVLGLQDGKYYVGKTSNPKMRLEQHVSGDGSEWTKIYKPETIVEVFEGDNYDEDKTVKKYMSRYGIDHVRGGSYVTVALSREERNFLQKEIRMTENKCVRCGRNNHFVAQCYATKDIDGKFISSKDQKRRRSIVNAGEQLEIELTHPTSSNTLTLVPCEEFVFVEDPGKVERADSDQSLVAEVSTLLTQVENIVTSPAIASTISYIKSWF